MLRVAERFGIDPRIVIYQWDAGFTAQMCAFEQLRQAEEARRAAAMMGVVG